MIEFLFVGRIRENLNVKQAYNNLEKLLGNTPQKILRAGPMFDSINIPTDMKRLYKFTVVANTIEEAKEYLSELELSSFLDSYWHKPKDEIA